MIAIPSGLTLLTPTGIGVPTVPAGSAIGYTWFEPLSVTYAVLPSGVTAIWFGLVPTPEIAVPGVLLATDIGVTVPAPASATYAIDPSGENAIPSGPVPTGIGVPTVTGFVVRSTGTMSLLPLSDTYAFLPSGEIAM